MHSIPVRRAGVTRRCKRSACWNARVSSRCHASRKDMCMTDASTNITQTVADPANWVDEYGDYLLQYAMSYVRDKQIAEDIVQETFLAALRSQKTFTGQSSLKTWLSGILKHKAIDHFRRARKNFQ